VDCSKTSGSDGVSTAAVEVMSVDCSKTSGSDGVSTSLVEGSGVFLATMIS
jgi:hypothetical protein